MRPRPHPQTRSEEDRRLLATWAGACAQRVLHRFEIAEPGDSRPRLAIAGAGAWTNGAIRVSDARALAVAAHAAARTATDQAAIAAARSAGHAAATAHMAGHARHAADYALKAVGCGDPQDEAAVRKEERWQRDHAPASLASFIYPTGL